MATPPKRAVGYARVSVDRDNETSTTTQEERIRGHCASHGWDVVEVIVESGRSAFGTSRSSRPGLARAKALIASGAADVLVCWKLDRAARNTKDALGLVDELRADGARFVSVTESFDTGTASGRMMFTMLSALAEMESATKSERTAEWHSHRRMRGATTTGPRPFGYRREANRLLVDKAEAAVIRRGAKHIIGGGSLRSFVMSTAQAGVVGTQTGAPINDQAMRRILTGPTIAALRETSPGVFVESSEWTPVLDRETWDAVRAVLLDPGRRTSPSSRRRWWLSGIATCGRCEGAPAMIVKGHASGPRYTCRHCYLSVSVAQTDELVMRDLFAMLDRSTWARLRRGGTPTAPDVSEFESAMAEVTARFIAGDIDHAELANVAEALRRQQQVTSVPAVRLPDVSDLPKSWPKLSLEQRRLIVQTATESLVIMPWVRGRGFDERRIVWTPVE